MSTKPTPENYSSLQIHKLSKKKYNELVAAGKIEENALYLTPKEAIDLSGYATEKFVTDEITKAQLAGEDVDLSGYATKDDIKDFITEIPSDYVTDTELANKGYATESYVDEAIKNVQPGGDSFDHSTLATKDEIKDFITINDIPAIPKVIDNLTSDSTTDALSAAQGKALKEAINSITGDIGDLGGGDMLKATYDMNNNGIVDNSEKLGGEPPSHYVEKFVEFAEEDELKILGIMYGKATPFVMAPEANKAYYDDTYDPDENNNIKISEKYETKADADDKLTEAKKYTDDAIANLGDLSNCDCEEVSWNQIQTSGTKIATIQIGDNAATDIYAPSPDGVGGGDTVKVTQELAAGTKIATINVNNTDTEIFAPDSSKVYWNQIQTSGTQIASINIDGSPIAVYAPTAGESVGDGNTQFTTYVGGYGVTRNEATTNGNTWLKLAPDDGVVKTNHKIYGTDGINVTSDSGGNIKISNNLTINNPNSTKKFVTDIGYSEGTFTISKSDLPVATSTTFGCIKVSYNEATGTLDIITE